ncbi:MAG: substrate-binding domain-containing protein [Pseudomonadota bacterium]
MKTALMTTAALSLAAFATTAEARDQIRIVGSSTVYPFSTTVAEQFGNKTGQPTPVVESTGSGGGIELFCSGVGESTPDITNSSRAIKSSELETCAANGVEVVEVQVGYDGIVVGHANEAPEADFSIPQLWQALAQQTDQDGSVVTNPYANWSDIDPSLPDQGIEVLGPPPTSGTRDAFVELVMEGGCEQFESVKALGEDEMATVCETMREDGGFVEAGENDNLIVQKLSENPNAYGIFGFSFLDQNRDKIKGSLIGGVEPTFEAIASGEYPVSRPLFFYVKKNHIDVIPRRLRL